MIQTNTVYPVHVILIFLPTKTNTNLSVFPSRKGHTPSRLQQQSESHSDVKEEEPEPMIIMEENVFYFYDQRRFSY